MLNYLKILSMAIMMQFLASCVGTSGALEVYQKIGLKSGDTQIDIDPGFYHSKVAVSKREVTLTVELPKGRERIVVNLPTDQIDPEKDSRTEYLAAEIKQKYNLTIDIKNTSVYTGPRIRFSECKLKETKLKGVRKIEFKERHSTRHIMFVLSDPQNGSKVAEFEGQFLSKGTVIDKKHLCR